MDPISLLIVASILYVYFNVQDMCCSHTHPNTEILIPPPQQTPQPNPRPSTLGRGLDIPDDWLHMVAMRGEHSQPQSDLSDHYVVEKVLGFRKRGRGFSVLVKWDGYDGVESVQWVPYKHTNCDELILDYFENCRVHALENSVIEG